MIYIVVLQKVAYYADQKRSASGFADAAGAPAAG